jgi:hypothetical protein
MPKAFSYWQRWLKRTRDETALFAKRRLIFAGGMAIIVSLASL